MFPTHRGLLPILHEVDPDSVVLFMDPYADAVESDEIRHVFAPTFPWIHERGREPGIGYECRYPGRPAIREDSYVDVSLSNEMVVVLSPAPTKLRYGLPDERQGRSWERK
jgi:hypothetical protein